MLHLKKTIAIFTLTAVLVGSGVYFYRQSQSFVKKEEDGGGIQKEPHPLSIEYMRKQEYSGSEIVWEQKLSQGINYDRYLVSYKSDGLKIYALLTVPQGEKPKTGWPVIIFNHGYIPPAEYRTTERYADYTDAFSRNGYIVFKSDYRGHGNSEGKPEGAYYSPAYTIDVLNAVASIKKYKEADPQKIGMWGHSMGGSLTLRSMVVTRDIKAGVIWAGVVSSYEDMAKNWGRVRPWRPSQREQTFKKSGRQDLIEKYGDFDKNPQFWQSIAPIYYVKDISGPVQIQHGTKDDEVPLLFSEKLNEALKAAGKEAEFITYPDDNHNLSGNLSKALQRSVEFFDKYLKDSQKQVVPGELKKEIEEALRGANGNYGVAIKNLKTGESYFSKEHEVFEPGSLYKLWIMAEVFNQIQAGKIKEDETLTEDVSVLNELFQIDKENAELSEGTITFTVKEALYLMIANSDNYAALLLSQKVRLSNVRTFLAKHNLTESELGTPPKTTASDIALFFEKLYKGELAGQEDTQAMISLLKSQTRNDKLPRYLPREVSIAHKTGEIGWFTHDAGIVFSPKGDFVIVVFSKSDSPYFAEERIANISKAVYDYFEKK